MYILSIDIGTTALKAALVTRTGKAAAYSKQPLEQGSKAALGWIEAVKAAVRAIASSLYSRQSQCLLRHIRAICISGNGPTIVAPDGTTLLWNADIGHKGQAAGGALRVSKWGKSIFLPRIAAFLSIYPDKWQEITATVQCKQDTQHFLFSGPEYLAWRLTGRAVTVLPEERYRSAYWTDDDLDALGIPRSVLPPFVMPAQMIGTLTEEGAEAIFPKCFDRGERVPVFCTGPDFIAAMIGTASLEEGRMYDCAGSSEGVNLVVSDEWLSKKRASLPQNVRVLPSVMPGLWNIAVMIEESGSIFVNYRRIAEAVLGREVPYSELIKKCLANKDSDGYEILQHIAQNFCDAVSALTALYPTSSAIVVTGGQAKNDEWMKMKSEASGAVLSRMECPDAELIGDAAVAWTGLGEYPSLFDAALAMCRKAGE